MSESQAKLYVHDAQNNTVVKVGVVVEVLSAALQDTSIVTLKLGANPSPEIMCKMMELFNRQVELCWALVYSQYDNKLPTYSSQHGFSLASPCRWIQFYGAMDAINFSYPFKELMLSVGAESAVIYP